MNVAHALHRAAALYGDLPAAICDDATLTHAQLDERSNRLAQAFLASGCRLGDRVATWVENSLACIELDFALAKAGLVRVSLNPRLTPAEARYILDDAEARAFVHGASYDAQIDAVVQASEFSTHVATRSPRRHPDARKACASRLLRSSSCAWVSVASPQIAAGRSP